MKVFVDTSAWISLTAAKDPHHEAVATAWREALAAGALPVTTSDVVSETITFLRYHASHRAAVDFHGMLDEARRQGRLSLVWVDQALWEQAWQVFLKRADWDLSMTDCTSLALCRKERTRRALTLDRHFLAYGLDLQPVMA